MASDMELSHWHTGMLLAAQTEGAPGQISSKLQVTLSPGITISVPSGKVTVPERVKGTRKRKQQASGQQCCCKLRR
jgi:hypothetical protein